MRKELEDSYLSQIAAQAKRRAAMHNVAITASIAAGHEEAIVDFIAAGAFDLLVIQ